MTLSAIYFYRSGRKKSSRVDRRNWIIRKKCVLNPGKAVRQAVEQKADNQARNRLENDVFFLWIFQLYLGLLDESKYDGTKYSMVEDVCAASVQPRPKKKWSSLKLWRGNQFLLI